MNKKNYNIIYNSKLKNWTIQKSWKSKAKNNSISVENARAESWKFYLKSQKLKAKVPSSGSITLSVKSWSYIIRLSNYAAVRAVAKPVGEKSGTHSE